MKEPPEQQKPEPHPLLLPLCYVCGYTIRNRRVIWARRDGRLRSMHRECAHPTPRVHGIVIR